MYKAQVERGGGPTFEASLQPAPPERLGLRGTAETRLGDSCFRDGANDF